MPASCKTLMMMSRRARLDASEEDGRRVRFFAHLLDPFRMNRSSVEFPSKLSQLVKAPHLGRHIGVHHRTSDIGVPEERKKAFKKGRTCRIRGNQVETQLSYYFLFCCLDDPRDRGWRSLYAAAVAALLLACCPTRPPIVAPLLS